MLPPFALYPSFSPHPQKTNAAPVDGSDKPAEATGGDAKLAVKRVRQVAAPAAAADGAQGE